MKNDLSHKLAIAIILAGVALAFVNPGNAADSDSSSKTSSNSNTVSAVSDR